jgi:predicted small integral membrane protein
MEQRYIKVGLAFTVGMLAGLWAINNLLNWETAHGAVAYALSQENQSGYSVRIVPPITSSSAATVGLFVIILTEAAAGCLPLLAPGACGRKGTRELLLSRPPSNAPFSAPASPC